MVTSLQGSRTFEPKPHISVQSEDARRVSSTSSCESEVARARPSPPMTVDSPSLEDARRTVRSTSTEPPRTVSSPSLDAPGAFAAAARASSTEPPSTVSSPSLEAACGGTNGPAATAGPDAVWRRSVAT